MNLKRFLPVLISAAIICTFRPCLTHSALTGEYSQGTGTELKKVVSNMNITFETSSQALSTALNQMIGKEIYRGSTKTSGLSADVLRNGPLSVAATDNSLFLTMPVTMSLRYGGFQAPAVSSKLKFRINPKITSDWRVNAEIQYLGLSDLMAEEAGLGLLSIKPRSIIDGITQPLQRTMSDLISRKINEKYSLRAEMEKVWIAAQKPVLVNETYGVWLKICPQEVMLYPLYAKSNQIKLTLGLKSLAEMVIGPEPEAPVSIPLPALKTGTSGDRSFRIALNTDIFYKDIQNAVAPLLLNKELGSDGKSIILKGLDIHSSGDKVGVRVEAAGSYNGIFHLTCRPSFNPEASIFSVEDVDFDMETQNFLLKSADWLLHSKIRNIIKENINTALSQRMQQAHEVARKAVDQMKLTEHFFLKGRVNALRLHEVSVQKEKISVRVYTEGETTVYFQ